MNLALSDMLALLAAFVAILMVGSTHLRLNLWLFALQTSLLSCATWLYAGQRHEIQLYGIAIVLFLLKALAVPKFLMVIIRKVSQMKSMAK